MYTDIVVMNIVLMSTDESVISSFAVLPICEAILALVKILKRLLKSFWNASFSTVSTMSICSKIKNIQASFLLFLCCSISYHFGFSPVVIGEL